MSTASRILVVAKAATISAAVSIVALLVASYHDGVHRLDELGAGHRRFERTRCCEEERKVAGEVGKAGTGREMPRARRHVQGLGRRWGR